MRGQRLRWLAVVRIRQLSVWSEPQLIPQVSFNGLARDVTSVQVPRVFMIPWHSF
jgi:hypothetical protein